MSFYAYHFEVEGKSACLWVEAGTTIWRLDLGGRLTDHLKANEFDQIRALADARDERSIRSLSISGITLSRTFARVIIKSWRKAIAHAEVCESHQRVPELPLHLPVSVVTPTQFPGGGSVLMPDQPNECSCKQRRIMTDE